MEHAVMDTNSKAVVRTRGRPQHPDRLTLSPEALERLNAWSAELEGRLRGVTLTRGQLVHWLICSHEAMLTTQEVRQLEEAHFDEVKFAEWALRELKAAQARGETISIAEIIGQNRVTRTDRNNQKTPLKQRPLKSGKETNTSEKTGILLDETEET
jgi:hypothetical protein